jgi:methyl-accepting chemotaxis protein
MEAFMKRRSLAVRFAFTAGLVVASVLVVMVTIIGFLSAQQSKEAATAILTETASHHANHVEMEIGAAMNASRGLGSLIESTVKDRAHVDRKLLNQYIVTTLKTDPFFFGVWAMVDPHCLEGNDTVNCVDGKELPSTIYSPYAHRSGDTTVFKMVGFNDGVGNEYYTLSHSSGKSGLTNPYVDPLANNAIMTSTTVPIRDGSRIIGVAGVDLVLGSFNSKMRNITPYSKSSAFLIGNNGLTVGHPIDSFAGKSAKLIGLSDSNLLAIRDGKTINQTLIYGSSKVKSHLITVPVYINSETAPWALGITVPESVLMAETTKQILWNVVLGIIGIAFLCLALMIMGKKFAKPIVHIAAQLDEIAKGEGDLTRRIDITSDDEIGDLADGFNRFLQKLQKMIQTIAGNTVTLSVSSENMSRISSTISTTSEEVSSQSAGVAAATEQATANINSISSAAVEMSASTDTVATAIEEMSSSLNEVSKNCQKELKIVTSASQHAHAGKETISKLGVTAQSIGRVIDVINNIASQTNLLALNAAIEAASAGDAGKGFTVVANEVKALARKTAQATDEIERQVKDIQDKSQSAIKAIEEIANVIEDVNSISHSIVSSVEEQSATIGEIAKNVSTVNLGSQEIARNVSESAKGLSEVSKNISGVSDAATDTARGIGQVKTSAEELAKLSESLKAMVSQFKI